MFHVPKLSILHDVLARCSVIVAFPNSTYISYTIRCCSTWCEKGLNLNSPCAPHIWKTALETTLHIHKFMKVPFTIERLFKNLPFTKTQMYKPLTCWIENIFKQSPEKTLKWHVCQILDEVNITMLWKWVHLQIPEDYIECQRPLKGLRMNTNSWMATLDWMTMYDAGPTRSTCTLKIIYIQSKTTSSNIELCGVLFLACCPLHVKEIK